MDARNRFVRLAARPVGLPRDSDWSQGDEAVPEPADGQVLVEAIYLSLDPAMRGWMNEGKSYIAPVKVGDVMRASGVGRIVASRHPKLGVGDHVVGAIGAQEYSLSDGKGLTRVDPALAPLPAYLGVLGLPGLTAYFGLLDVGQAREGNTVVVSGAAGAVGSVVGQIAKIKGCRAVGIAGGADKCAWLSGELGFDAAIDYKGEDVKKALKAHCPAGIDVFFDNVGGEILDTALTQLGRGARVVVCGAISQYNNTTPVRGPSNYLSLLVNRASMTGMVVFDYADRYGAALAEMAGWLRAGTLKSRVQVVEGGIDRFPEALNMLFKGENTGKLVLQIKTA